VGEQSYMFTLTSHMTRKSAVAAVILLVLCIPSVYAQPQGSARTVLDGVYTEQQAARGKTSYTAVCSVCHGKSLEGISAPALTGDRFIERWREGMLDGFYDFIRQNMPPGRQGRPGPIPDHDYLDILTYILNMNGYRGGTTELTPDLLGSVMLVGKNGPQPVPDGSLVTVVGCLSEANDGLWTLSNATEPVRARASTSTTPEELQASSRKTSGSLVFRLTDFEAVAVFVPGAHKGSKVQVKGYLVRQTNAERIGLSAVDVLDSVCRQ